MARVTKIRAPQTRAAEKYDIVEESLATDNEVETRVRKHSSLFHHNRNDNTQFIFDSLGRLSEINIIKPGTIELLQKSIFTFDIDNNLSNITKTIYDGLEIYTTLSKDFIYLNGNLLEIQNKTL